MGKVDGDGQRCGSPVLTRTTLLLRWAGRGVARRIGVLGSVAVIVHEVYIVMFSNHPVADPFVHVMTEMAVLVPGSAMVFIALATFRNRLLFIKSG